MNPTEEMIKAVRDWTKGRIGDFEKKLNINTLLRNTGDASKVTSKFTKHGSRVLPASGETLDITLGKILQYLNDLGKLAFSGNYDDVVNKPIVLCYKTYSEALLEAIEIPLYDQDGSAIISNLDTHTDYMLLIGQGGSVNSNQRNATDFFRSYLLCRRYPNNISSAGSGIGMIQLGNLGSTARWSLASTLTTAANPSKSTFRLKIPKGAWAEIEVYGFESYRPYS